MYKVFLVDDEIVVREGIRDNIKWENTNYIFSGEATDGEIALPLIQEIKPDILITDIKMPFMDGLELSRIVRKNMPWIKIIVLSGHDEFKYAKEAISIGVTDYLLKPISSTELIEALNKVAFQIEDEKKQRENIEKLKRQLESNQPLFRDRFLNELSLGLIPPVDVIERCASFGIPILSKYYLVVIIEIEIKKKENHGREYSEILKAESLISRMVEDNRDIIKFKRNVDEFVFILKGDHVSMLEESGYSFAQSLKYEIERNTRCELTIGIGSAKERIQGITQSLQDAEIAKSYKYIFGNNKIIGIHDIKTNIVDKKELMKLDKTTILEFLKCGVKADIDQVLNSYLQCLSETSMKSMIYTYYIFMDIILTASRFVDELGGEVESIIPEISKIESIMADLDSPNSFKELAKSILTRIFDFRDSRIESKYESIISKAKDYISGSYQTPQISLNSVASYVNVSPSHFSTVFSQETGETFIEYLTKIRMKKAMELLKTTTQKSSEIAYAVGYNDPHYFSYLFKKTTGITPKEFRIEGRSE